MLKRLKIPFEIILVLIVMVVTVSMAVRPPNSVMNWFVADDVFYYFKTAQNIAAGKGVTFDGISQSNGFHPLWMLICIPVFSLANTVNLILPLAHHHDRAGTVQRRDGGIPLPFAEESGLAGNRGGDLIGVGAFPHRACHRDPSGAGNWRQCFLYCAAAVSGCQVGRRPARW